MISTTKFRSDQPALAQHTTDYAETLILVSPDTNATEAKAPANANSVAGRQYRMMAHAPYAYTSDDVIFTVHADRHGVAPEQRAEARRQFFSRGQGCLRTSPLVRTHGWGVHSDRNCRVALVAMESGEYRALAEDGRVAKVAGMRSKRP